jgi:type I restriction enzyme M protein
VDYENNIQEVVWELLTRVRGRGEVEPNSILVPVAGSLYLRHLASVEGLLPSHLYQSWLRSVHIADASAQQQSLQQILSTLIDAGIQQEIVVQTLKGLQFEHPYRVEVQSDVLRQIVSAVDGLPINELAAFLDHTLERVARSVSRIDFLSPRPVTDLMIRVAEIKPGYTIYDPAFGTGNLLTLANDAVSHDSSGGVTLFGQEINADAFLIGNVRLALRSLDNSNLALGNTILAPRYRPRHYGGFDRVLCVPPIGRRSSMIDHPHFASKKLEVQFLDHIVRSLKPQGRAVVAIPEGVLFSRTEAELRRWLATDFRIEGIISLPAGALGTFTSIESSLIVLSRRPALGSIVFVDGRALPSFKRRRETQVSEYAKVLDQIAGQLGTNASSQQANKVPIETIEKRDWSFASNETAEVLEDLIRNSPEAEWRPLADIAEVYRGLRIVNPALSDGTEGERYLLERVVRVGDLPASVGSIRKELDRNWVRVTPGQAEPRRLRKGDIVLSADGTIGKIGNVDSSVAGALPASGVFVVRPRDNRLAEHLVRVLRMEVFQEWLRGEAVGTVIKHLSIESIRRLLIPLRLDKLSGQAADEQLMALVRMLNRASRSSDSFAGTEDQWRTLSNSASNLRNWLAHLDPTAAAPSNGSGNEAEQVMKLIHILQGVAEIPPSAARYAVLQDALNYCRQPASVSLTPYGQLLVALGRLVEGELRRLGEDNLLELHVSPSEIPASQPAAITFQITNAGSLPLREVSSRLIETTETKYIGFLPEHESVNWDVVLPAQDTPGLIHIGVLVSTKTLGGATINHRLLAEVVVNPTTAGSIEEPLVVNPYITGNPIDNKRKDMFFGRADVMETIVRQLGSVQAGNSVLLEGNRRVGKTSILKQLEANPEVNSIWIPVYCSFQAGSGADGKLGMPTKEVYRLLIRRLGLEVHKAGRDVQLSTAGTVGDTRNFRLGFSAQIQAAFGVEVNSFAVFESYLIEVLEAVKPKRILFLLDEFDKIKEGIESGVTSPMVPESLRYLIQSHSGLAMVFSGSKRLKELREGYWSALFGIGRRVSVGSINVDSARMLVTEPVRGVLTYTDEARDLIVRLAACQPFMIQSLCNYVFEDCVNTGDRIVTVEVVDRSSSELVVENEHLASLWDFAGTDTARLVLHTVADLGNGPDVADIATVESNLALQGAELEEELLERTLVMLEEKEFLIRERNTNGDKGHTYTVALPLFATWILRYKNFDEVLRRAIRELEG